MSYGLVSAGRQIKGEAMQGMAQDAQLDEQRAMTNKSLKEAKRQQETTAVAGGAATGAMMGAKYGTAFGPYGMAIGAVLGGLAGWALS
jgi:uncharacterized membrane protein